MLTAASYVVTFHITALIFPAYCFVASDCVKHRACLESKSLCVSVSRAPALRGNCRFPNTVTLRPNNSIQQHIIHMCRHSKAGLRVCTLFFIAPAISFTGLANFVVIKVVAEILWHQLWKEKQTKKKFDSYWGQKQTSAPTICKGRGAWMMRQPFLSDLISENGFLLSVITSLMRVVLCFSGTCISHAKLLKTGPKMPLAVSRSWWFIIEKSKALTVCFLCCVLFR